MKKMEVIDSFLKDNYGYLLSSELLDPNFPEQTNFILDKARLKALFCTRRAAKSYTGGLYMVKECLENPGVNCLFIGLTRSSAEGIVWKDILKDIDRKNNLNISFNQTKLTATFPNGSVIWVTGVDADEDEMDKLLGKKYRLVILDEASMYSVNLNQLVYGVLKPAVADNRGTICMMGTSSNIPTGLFFDITNKLEPGWSLHTWTAHDNPYVAKQWQEELDEIKNVRPLFMQTTLFKQWYLNLWVVDEDKLVYRYLDHFNHYTQLPYYPYGAWNYVLGVDQGYEDPSAFSVCAFHENDPILYVVETFKKSKMDITDVANKIKEYQQKYPLIYKVVIDGSAKQAVEEIQRRHGISLTAADKTGKSDFIEIMNSEFIQGKIKLNAVLSQELIDEYKKLVWELEGEKVKLPRKENGACANHLTDATLYAWRDTYAFLSKAAAPKINLKDKAQYIKHTEKLMEDSLQKQIEHEKYEEEGDIWSFNSDPFDMDSVYKNIISKRKS